MRNKPKWLILVLVLAAVLYNFAPMSVWSSPPQHKPVRNLKPSPSANQKNDKSKKPTPQAAPRPPAMSGPAAKGADFWRATKGSGVVYTPDTIRGDDDITIPAPTLLTASVCTAPMVKYTVIFDKNVEEEESLAVVVDEDDDDPAPATSTKILGARFKVHLYEISKSDSTVPLKHKKYTITGLNGVVYKQNNTEVKSDRASFVLTIDPEKFEFPTGKNTMDVLMVVTRKNSDAKKTVKIAAKLITLHKQVL